MIRSEHIDSLIAEVGRGIEKHGDWENYAPEDIYLAVEGELEEVKAALDSLDYHGEHGMAAELLQVAAVAMKGHIKLRGNNGN